MAADAVLKKEIPFIISENKYFSGEFANMFTINESDINAIFQNYGIHAGCSSFKELQRYYYEKDDPESRQVRLIIRADLTDGRSFVLRFKNEDDAPQEIIEEQSRFAALLYERGIETPKAYTSDGFYASHYTINGYDVVVTLEDFKDGEITEVNPKTAKDTGALLAAMHNVAEEAGAHVNSEVLFDPLTDNDLFSFDAFDRHRERLLAVDSKLYHDIVRKHSELISRIEPLGNEPRYAVQGDISDCNLYRTEDGRIGVFDFNRCGDNNLFFDAVMQAVFEARLMDYPAELAGHQEETIFASFLEGYQQIRPFTTEQRAAFPYLYALINAFWGVDMKWSDRSFTKAVESADDASIHQWMKEIYKRETALREIRKQGKISGRSASTLPGAWRSR